MMEKLFQPEDLRHLRYVSWPMLSREGKRAAYVVKTSDEESGLHIPQVRWIDLTTKQESALEAGTSMPFFLADGKRMTCLSNRSGEDQVWLFDLDSGESRQLTHLRHGVNRYRLSADEHKLVFEAILWPEEVEAGQAFTEMTAEEKSAWEEELDLRPYVVTELVYKMDEWYGMRKGEYEHIGVVDIATGEGRILPTGMAGIYPTFSPDGQAIAYYGYPYHNAYGYAVELMLWNLADDTQVQLSEKLSIAKDHTPIFTPDGEAIITFAYFGAGTGAFRIRLADKSCLCLMDENDDRIAHGVNPLVTNRTENGASPAYAYLDDAGEWLYFLSAWEGRTNVYRVSAKAQGVIELVHKGNTDIQGFYMNEKGTLACAMGNLHAPAEFFVAGEQLSHCNAWLDEYPQGQIDECWLDSRDGTARLHYFLVHPVKQAEGQLYPAVVDIKGGPTTMYSAAYWHEVHALAAKGFAVICPNIRGSVGFGRDYCKGAVCWKPEALHDVEDILNHAIAQGFIDSSRVGVTGGSYGGYLVNKLIGRTKLFAAAVTQRSLVNPATSYGTGDIGFVSAGKIPKNFRMLDYLVDRARDNPITYIDNIDIPLLILHAYCDYRCSFEQGEQMFIAMKERHPDVPVRFVMFPDENHALTRTGKLHNQVRHLTELVNWFAKYLQKEEAKDE